MNCANHSDRQQTAFCQNCGKPLCQECTRSIGPAVYCEPCLAAKLAGAPAAAPPPQSYGYVDPAAAAYSPIPMQPPPHGAPNPILAGILGFIPGVGAMYNEQYAKAGVHLIVFVVLVSLANSNAIFGILVAGWEFYMAFEAFHTARCRRDGLPLPNPFGLNDLGHKLGFDKSFQAPAASAPVPPDPYAAPYGAVPPPAAAPSGYPPPYASPYPPPGAAAPPSWDQTPAWEQYNQSGWQSAPPMPPPVPLDAQVPYPGNRFPAGAIWLIGLGAIFLVFNAGFMSGISGRLFLPVLLIGLAVFIFVRKLTDYGYGLANDGTVDYRIRVFRALRGSVWLALVGLLFFLDEFTPLHWDHSWPLFIILAGVMTVLQRAVYSGATPARPPYMPGYGYPPAQQPAPAPPTPAPAPSTGVVPASTPEGFTHEGFTNDRPTNDKEGS